MKPLIRCEAAAGVVNPCGVLGVEQIAEASAAGVCCLVWLRQVEEVDW